MELITVPMSDEQRRQWCTRLCECRCNDSHPFIRNAPQCLHKYGRLPGAVTTRLLGPLTRSTPLDLVRIICDELNYYAGSLPHLNRLYDDAGNARRARRSGRSPCFPATMQEFLPFDVEDTVHTLLWWMQADITSFEIDCSQSRVSNLFSTVINTCGHQAIYAFLSAPDNKSWLLSHVARMIMSGQAENNEVLLFERVINISITLTQLLAWLTLAQLELWTRGGRFLLIASCVHHVKFIRANMISLSDSVIDQEKKLSTRDNIALWTGFTAKLVEYYSIKPYLFSTDDEPAKRLFEEHVDWHDDPRTRVAASLMSIQEAGCCMAPECLNTFAGLKLTFKRCGGCNVVSYCSAKCQRAAWRHPSVNHKDVCAFFREAASKGITKGARANADLS
jgi:hypothetical protein